MVPLQNFESFCSFRKQNSLNSVTHFQLILFYKMYILRTVNDSFIICTLGEVCLFFIFNSSVVYKILVKFFLTKLLKVAVSSYEYRHVKQLNIETLF